MTLISIVFVAYLLFVLIVGAVASRYGRTMEGFFLADRGLGSWVTAISSVASSESGWLVIGLVGMSYQWGAQAVWTVPGVLLGYVCNWYLVAPRLRQHTKTLGAITIPGVLAARLGDRWNLLRGLGILTILFCMMFYVSAQFTATGKAFQIAFGESYGITYAHGVLLGGLITILYTLVGGFRAVSWTDLTQGLLMAFGLVVLPIVTVSSVGGIGALKDALETTPPRYEAVITKTEQAAMHQIGVEADPVELEPGLTVLRQVAEGGDYHFAVQITPPAAGQVTLDGHAVQGELFLFPGDRLEGKGRSYEYDKRIDMVGGEALLDPLGGAAGLAMLGWVIGLLGIGFGYPGQPHVLTRYMAARSRQTILRARIIAIVWGCLALYGAVVLGLAARVAVPGLVDPEQAYPHLATTQLHPILGGILLAAIISAMMSTADSQLLVVSSAVARDLIDQSFEIRRRFSVQGLERMMGWIARGSVLLVGLLALIMALGEVRAVFWFVLFAWSGLGAAFGPPILLALFWRRTNLWGALAGMLTGLIVTILWKMSLGALVEAATGLDLYELVPAFALALFATWGVSLLTPPAKAIPRGLEGLTD